MTTDEQKAWDAFVGVYRKWPFAFGDEDTRDGVFAADDELKALRTVASRIDVDGLAKALFGNEMLYSDYNAESRTGPVPKIWEDVSEGDKGYFREIAITVVAYLKEG
jgi:hypothetical protein